MHRRGRRFEPGWLHRDGYFEWVQNLQHFRWDETEVNQKLERVMQRAYVEVSARAEADGESLRVSAFALGIERVLDAARIRGYIA